MVGRRTVLPPTANKERQRYAASSKSFTRFCASRVRLRTAPSRRKSGMTSAPFLEWNRSITTNEWSESSHYPKQSPRIVSQSRNSCSARKRLASFSARKDGILHGFPQPAPAFSSAPCPAIQCPNVCKADRRAPTQNPCQHRYARFQRFKPLRCSQHAGRSARLPPDLRCHCHKCHR